MSMSAAALLSGPNRVSQVTSPPARYIQECLLSRTRSGSGRRASLQNCRNMSDAFRNSRGRLANHEAQRSKGTKFLLLHFVTLCLCAFVPCYNDLKLKEVLKC